MTLEATQLLSTVAGGPYKPTHKNHPCTRWVRESAANFEYTKELGIALAKEYTHRYGKVHKCQAILEGLTPPSDLPRIGKTPFALCMPEEYQRQCAVTSYRSYYREEKKTLHNYTSRDVPVWLD